MNICHIALYHWPPTWECKEVITEIIDPGIGVELDPYLFTLYVVLLSLAGIVGSLMVWWVDVKLEIALDNANKREEIKRLSKMWHP